MDLEIGRPRGDIGCFSYDAKGAHDDCENGFKEHYADYWSVVCYLS